MKQARKKTRDYIERPTTPGFLEHSAAIYEAEACRRDDIHPDFAADLREWAARRRVLAAEMRAAAKACVETVNAQLDLFMENT